MRSERMFDVRVLEKRIEAAMRLQVEKMGGKFLKWVSPGNDGVPDRIAILPNGEVWFIELKADDGVVAPLQAYWQQLLTSLGCNAIIIKGCDAAVDWCTQRRLEIEAWKEARGGV